MLVAQQGRGRHRLRAAASAGASRSASPGRARVVVNDRTTTWPPADGEGDPGGRRRRASRSPADVSVEAEVARLFDETLRAFRHPRRPRQQRADVRQQGRERRVPHHDERGMGRLRAREHGDPLLLHPPGGADRGPARRARQHHQHQQQRRQSRPPEPDRRTTLVKGAIDTVHAGRSPWISRPGAFASNALRPGMIAVDYWDGLSAGGEGAPDRRRSRSAARAGPPTSPGRPSSWRPTTPGSSRGQNFEVDGGMLTPGALGARPSSAS